MRHLQPAATRLFLVPLTALLVLSGCKQGDDLDRRIEAAKQRVAELEQDVAEKDALIERVKALQIQEARLAQQLSPPTPEAIEAAFAPLHGMRVISERADAIIITGRAPLGAFAERLEVLGTQQPGLQAKELNVDGEAVEIQLALVQPEEPPSSRRRAPLGGVLPWNASRRDTLLALERRVVELTAQLPDFVHGRRDLQWRINTLQGLMIDARDSRRALLGVARAVSEPKPSFAPLELRWSAGKVLLGGRPTADFDLGRFKSGPPAGLTLSETFQQENWVTTVVQVDPSLLKAPSPPTGSEATDAAASGTAAPPAVEAQTAPEAPTATTPDDERKPENE